MLYTKPKNSCKIGQKAMQKRGIKGEVLTLDDPLQEQHFSWFSKLESTQEHQEQLPSTSVTKRRCNTRCLCAIVRLKHT